MTTQRRFRFAALALIALTFGTVFTSAQTASAQFGFGRGGYYNRGYGGFNRGYYGGYRGGYGGGVYNRGYYGGGYGGGVYNRGYYGGGYRPGFYGYRPYPLITPGLNIGIGTGLGGYYY